MVQIPLSDFLKHLFTKYVGPPLGVNQMWTKRNDHASKSEFVDFFNFNTCQKDQFWRKEKIAVWPFFGLLLSSTSLPQEIH